MKNDKEGERLPIFRNLSSKQDGFRGHDVPEMGSADVIIEKGRSFENPCGESDPVIV